MVFNFVFILDYKYFEGRGFVRRVCINCLGIIMYEVYKYLNIEMK